MDAQIRQYAVPKVLLPDLVDKVGQLNRRAEKLGCDPMTAEVTREWSRDAVDADGRRIPGQVEPMVDVTVTGDPPKAGGWSFAAVLEATDAGNLVVGPGAGEVPSEYREADPCCDHCGLDRARKQTYLVVSDEGEWAQVGSACVKDFTGHDLNPKTWLSAAEDVLDEFDDAQNGTGGEHRYDTREFLAATACAVRHNGWVPRHRAGWGLSATADDAATILSREPGTPAPDDLDYEVADRVVEWAAGWDDPSDYAHNVRVALGRSDGIGRRDAGIAASAVAVWRKRNLEAKQREERSPAPEGKTRFGGVVVGVGWKESDYGPQAKMTVDADDGYRVRSTVPAPVCREVAGDIDSLVGRRIEMTATLTPSDKAFGFYGQRLGDDPTFAYAKRPSKAELGPVPETAAGGDPGHGFGPVPAAQHEQHEPSAAGPTV